MGDPVLAEFMRRHDPGAPVEKILRTDFFMTALNGERLRGNERIVILECGHYAITANSTRCRCSFCHEMILNGEDYEAFRNR